MIMMILLKILAAVSCVFYIIIKMKTGFHMLQQNSYMNTHYLGWAKKNITKNISMYDILPGIAFFCVIIFTHETYSYLVLIAANIIMVYRRFKSKVPAKKPLVITARVKRLLLTALLVCIALGIFIYIGFCDMPHLTVVAVMLLNAAVFLLVALMNLINRPVELLINRWYYNDAVKIIRAMPSLRVIGITGSYGKTSSKYILARILSEKYHTLMTPESYNTTMGVIRTIRERLKPSHEIFVCEMGAKYVHDIKEICDLVHPEYGVITSIGPQHLETFGSIENIIKTKFELVDSLRDKSKAILNFSSALVRENAPGEAASYSLDEQEGGEFFAREISYGPSGSKFQICQKGKEPFEIETKLLGKHNIINIIGAAGIALRLGLTPDEIAYAVRRLEPVPHRLQLRRQAGGITVIDDAFNSNVEGAQSAVEVLGSFPAGKRMLITPGIVELGEKEYEYNYRFGTQAAKQCDFIILVGERQTRPIQKGVSDAGFDESRLYIAKDLNDALGKMREVATAGWTVLFENDLPDLYDN